MAKIITLKEEMLIGGNSQEQIYPKTHTKAVFSADGTDLQSTIDNVEKGDLLEDNSIKTRHIADGNVTTEKLEDAAVTSEKIGLREVKTANIAVKAITYNELDSAAVTKPKIAEGAVVTTKIADAAVTADKIADQSISSDKLAEGSVRNEHITDTAVDTRTIQNNAVTTDKINDKAVTYSKMAAKAVGNTHLVDASVDNRVLDDNAVTTEKIADASVTGAKLQEHTVSEDKVAADAVSTRTIVDGNVTERKLGDDAVSTVKIINEAVTTPKIKDGAVTNDKLADKTITIDKFESNLKNAIEAATGMPDDVMKQFLQLSESVSALQDTVYPITLGLNINYVSNAYSVNFTVRNQGKAFTPDTLLLSKTLANGTVKTLSNIPASDGVASTPVESNREIFKLDIAAKGHTSKSTSQTRYICYAGADSAATISTDIVAKFGMRSTTSVNFNPSVTTAAGQYIWLVVPEFLTINKVTSSGFDVTLSAAQTVTTSLGNFKAYRTANTLTAATWNLVIS